MKEFINFSTKFESLEQINPLISKYRINICVPDKPANKYVFSKSIIESMSNTIRGAGVYAYYFEKDNQLGGHEDDVVHVGKGFKRTGIPVAYGFSDPYQEPYWMEKNGEEWYTTNVYIWTGRNPEIAEILEKSIVMHSMEVAVDDEPDIYGNKNVKEALFLGFCLLQGIDPAFSGSQITKFSLPDEDGELDKLKKEYESFAHRYSVLDFTIPQEVKKSAQDGLNLNKELGRGGTAVSLAISRFLIKNENATPEKIRHISKYFNRHFTDDFNDRTSNSWIAWQLNGGDTGYKWSTKINDEMNELDKKKLAFMSETKEDENVIKEAVEKFSLNSAQITEILQNALAEYKYGENSWRKYWVNAFDAEYVYVCDCEDDKTYGFTYSVADNVATVNMESKEEVIRGSYVFISKQEETTDLSANQNVDAVAMQALNEKAAEENKKLAEENEGLKTQLSEVQEKMSAMEADVAKAKEDSEVYMKENEELKTFKADIEKQNKSFAVETTLKDVADVLPEDEMNACRSSAENFTLADIDIWKNEVQAKAFKFSKNIPEKREYLWMALPNAGTPKKGNGLWD